MESLGILLGLVGGLVASPLFCLALVYFVRPLPLLAAFGFWVSVIVLAIATVEISLLAFMGPLRLRELVGPSFSYLHFVFTGSAPAALACVSILGRRTLARWWYAVAVVCWLIGAGVIFLQYDVSETLYGIDGTGGPYSTI